MPGPQPPAHLRQRCLAALFWVGVGVAPIAVLLLLVGDSGTPLRVAAALMIVCVVCIGFSVALRDQARSVRLELEATLFEEVDALRDETREDIVAVARKLHTSLRAEVADLADEMDRIRGQLPARPAGHVPELPQQPAQADPLPAHGAASGSAPVRSTGSWSPRPAIESRAAAQVPRPSPRPRPNRVRPYVDPDRTPARRQSWDPLTDDLADRPAAYPASPVTMSPTAGGRRRAPESDLVPVAELESAHHRPDPWADLRGNTEPAQVRLRDYERVSYRW